MKVLRGTLTFVLGMVLGIVLLVLAIGGTVLALGTTVKVGKLQSSIIGAEIIAPESELYNKTVLDAVKGVIDDVQNFDKLSLKTLYEHYGIELLNGISGLDFKDKDFYDVPLTELINDLSVLINSFTLNDIGTLTGIDFSSDTMPPIVRQNINSSVKTAMDNIMGSINSDISIRSISTNLGLNLGVDDNALLKELQDVKISEFGKVINVLTLSTLINVDTDTFVLSENRIEYVYTDKYEEVSAQDLANKNYIPKKGAEEYFCGGKDTTGDGEADAKDIREMRYTKTKGGEYVIDNSCYDDSFDASKNTTKYYRHLEFVPVSSLSQPPANNTNVFVEGYANKIATLNGQTYTLISKTHVPVSSLTGEVLAEGGLWAMTDETIDKDSILHEVESPADVTYIRIQKGSATQLLQTLNYTTVKELQNADDLISNLTIGDIVDMENNSSKLLESLKDSTLKTIGDDINDLTISDIIDIVNDDYIPDADGKYVFDEENGCYVLYNPATHEGLDRYRKEEVEGASSALLQRFSGATIGGFSTAFDSMSLADVMQIDADVYAPLPQDFDFDSPEHIYYYDATTCVYRIANEEFRNDPENADVKYYHVVSSGESASVLKKLAYVKVDNLADAMEAVIDDMLLSELLEIYTENAVVLSDLQHNEDGEYFIEYNAENPLCGEDEKGKYMYVLDSSGDLTFSNFRYVEKSAAEFASELAANPTKYVSHSVTYEYKKFSELDALSQAKAVANENLYYLYDGKYHHDVPICLYIMSLGSSDSHYGRIYCKVAAAGGANTYTATVYTGVSDNTVYVRGAMRGFKEIDSTNLAAFAISPSDNMAFEGVTYYVKETAAEKSYLIPLSDLSAAEENDALKYARRSCETVFIKDDNGDYVYVNGQYIAYNEDENGEDERFIKKVGYIAASTELYYQTGASEFTPIYNTAKTVSDYARKKSAPVLRLLASDTVANMSKIIENATVADLIDAESGSLFDNELIKSSKISELDKAFKVVLTDMTIGDLVSWSDINMDSNVKTLLTNVSATQFFTSLTWDNGRMYVDMFKLYGYAD